MKPGSWLEISNFQHEKMLKIKAHSSIEKFLLKENFGHEAPDFPFILLIEKFDEINISNWKNSEFFNGFLLRTSQILVGEWPVLENYPVWIEFVVSDLKIAEVSSHALNKWPVEGYFITAGSKITSAQLVNLLKKKDLRPLQRPHDIPHEDFIDWHDLETFSQARLEQTINHDISLSIIIPHYENPYFLCNVLNHLDRIAEKNQNFEVIIVDDGSSETTIKKILYFSKRHLSHLNFRFFKWEQNKFLQSGEKVFRAGASRNWGAEAAKGHSLLFLDSDMLVPDDIVSFTLDLLNKHDVIQFVRLHIPRTISSETAQYQNLISSKELYIEEASYWTPFFNSDTWSDLTDYWKYTCTYGLAMHKNTFLSVGRIRRNYIQYGFEDTDLGYRLFKAGCRFHLSKKPLLHLTQAAQTSQGFIFKINKMNRIKPMAKTFFNLNLDPNIYLKFQSLLD